MRRFQLCVKIYNSETYVRQSFYHIYASKFRIIIFFKLCDIVFAIRVVIDIDILQSSISNLFSFIAHVSQV